MAPSVPPMTDQHPLGLEVLTELAAVMFEADDHGRLVGEAPALHVLRSPLAVVHRLHVAVPDQTAAALRRLIHRPRGRHNDWATDYAD